MWSKKKTNVERNYTTNQGIYPDVMHVLHLAIYPDVISSFLLDNSDGKDRDKKLTAYWDNYRDWAESQGSLLDNISRPSICV